MKKVPLLVVLGVLVPSTAPAQDALDPDVLAQIREEGFQRSQVMDLAWYLTDVLGPRVTGSEAMRQAQNWLLEHMNEMGIAAHSESIGEVGPSWDNRFTSLHMTAPRYQPLIGYPYAFTQSTEGRERATVKVVSIQSEEDFGRYRGTLRGTAVLNAPPVPLEPNFLPDASRFTDAELKGLEEAVIGAEYGVDDTEFFWDSIGMLFREVDSEPWRAGFAPVFQRFLLDEGVTVILAPGGGRDGTVQVDERPGSRYDRSTESIMGSPPVVAVAAEHYNQLHRLASRGIPTEVEVEIRNLIGPEPAEGFNLVGELPGSDLRDELVIVGAHLDSWHAGTGAVDDATGVALILEAVRILQEIQAPLRRTVRVALFTYEEGGKVGSRAYVDRHFLNGDGNPNAAHGLVSAYFNLDHGTGRFRGLHLQGNERARPVIRSWAAPFSDLGLSTVTVNNAFGLDVIAFDMVGIPAFHFFQDNLDYWNRPYHSNMDVFDRLVAEELRINSVILAGMIYQAANADGMVPREIR